MHKNIKEIQQILKRYNLQDDKIAKSILEDNWLSEKQIELCKKSIIMALCGDKVASKNPLAIIVGGQPGAGKTALINYTLSSFNSREFVVIDNDLFRAFHPNVAEIRLSYPEYYTCATEQLGADITSDIIDYFTGKNQTKSRYNIILHQTLSSMEKTENYLKHFDSLNYVTGLRVLAVPYIESKMSQVERCEAQYNSLGYCRYVDAKHHYNSVGWLVDTVKEIEENKLCNFVQVFERQKDISNPKCVYSAVINNDDRFEKFVKTIRDDTLIAEDKNGFESASKAIETVRETQTCECLQTLEKRVEQAVFDGALKIPGMWPHLNEVCEFMKANLQEDDSIEQ